MTITKREKDFLDDVQNWIAECDVDGRGISFSFFDSDANDLMLLCKNFIELKKETTGEEREDGE